MAKKVNAQRVEARRLFEEDGLSLKEISEKLGINKNTIWTWKRRDKWIQSENESKSQSRLKNSKRGNVRSNHSKRGSNPNSIQALKDHKAPNFTTGNKEALKHSLYVDHSGSTVFKEAFKEGADITTLNILREQITFLRAQIIASQGAIEEAGAAAFTGLSKITESLAGSIDKYEKLLGQATKNEIEIEKLRSIQLDNDLKQKDLNERIAQEESRNLNEYKGLPIDAVAPVFSQLHFDVNSNKFREFVLPGGRGSTKSSFISLEIINLLERHPNTHALVCRQIDKDLRDSVYNQLKWAIDKLDLNDEYRCTLKPLEITKIATGQKIYFTGLSDPTSVKSFTPTFGYVGILWFEELDQIRGDETVRKVEQSVIRGGESFYIFKSFNPPRSKNNWANLYADVPKESMHVYRSTYLDVPPEWLGRPFIEEAEVLKEINPDAYLNEYMGEANGSGGNVFPNLVVREITDEEIARFDDIDNGMDFGWVHPTAFIRTHYDPARSRLYVFEEAGGSHITNQEMAEIIKARTSPNDYVTGDSEDPRTINELNNYGVNVIGAKKGPNSRSYGYKWLAMLKEFIIDPVRCPNTYKQAVNMEYERDKEGNITSLIPKIDDDYLDAIRYANERHSRRHYDPFD